MRWHFCADDAEMRIALKPAEFDNLVVTGSRAEIRVWIDCPACGRLEKLVHEVELPSEIDTPALENTCALCDRCHGLAVMCFERKVSRLH